MRNVIFASLCIASAFAHAEPTITYDITIQDKYGTEKQQVTLPLGAQVRQIEMAAALIEVSPPAIPEGQSLLKLHTNKQDPRTTQHSALIARPAGEPVRIAYVLCPKGVIYQAPAPQTLATCESMDAN